MKYYLYIDECGNPYLPEDNPGFSLFTLCGLLFSDDSRYAVYGQVMDLKKHFWGDQDVVLHSRDIRRCRNRFDILLDPTTKADFYERLNSVLGQDAYKVIACVVDKTAYSGQYGMADDPYTRSLQHIIENTVLYLDGIAKDEKIDLRITIERRGKSEDKQLFAFFNRFLQDGSEGMDSGRLNRYHPVLKSRTKKEDIIGLQLADLVAYPLTRYYLSPDHTNFAYEVFKKNLYHVDRLPVKE